MTEIVIGLDLGTQGVRALAVDCKGEVLANAQESLPPGSTSLPAGWFEQNPQEWWDAVQACLRKMGAILPGGTRIAGISIDSTSGTILPLGANHNVLHPALMYNDMRSEKQAARVQAAAHAHQERFGFSFGSSYALTKLAWFKEERPEIFSQTQGFIHAADFLVGKLSGEFIYSDTSNALKTGYDLIDFRWPDFIENELGISIHLLPKIVPIGTQIGTVCRRAEEETGVPFGTPIYAGASDGTAAQIASGAAEPGDWNSTLGTTLVFKGVTRSLIADPLGRVYFHRHPEGWWMPGGASNTGTDWIMADQPGADFSRLDKEAEGCLPTRLLRYPLSKPGERFPFIRPDARGFMLGEPSGAAEKYAAGMEGVAMIERLAYKTLAAIGLEVGERVYLTGGGVKSKLWTRIRASVLQKTLIQPMITETAFGAAVIAANGCWYDSISQASRAMVHAAQTTLAEPTWTAHYEEQYARFTTELGKRGYLEPTR